MKLFSSPHSITVVAGSLVAIVSIAAIAQAATDTIYKYTTPKNGTFQISALAMIPEWHNTEYDIDYEGALVSYNNGCFSTSVHLPQGATIAAITGFYSSGAGTNPHYQFARYTVNNGAFVSMALKAVQDGTGNRKPFQAPVIKGEARVVNNNQHSYVFLTCLGSENNKFHGARVSYTYTHAGD
jgi:hypothetical protein